MIRYLARRALFGLLVVALVTTSVFGLVYVAGDPAATALGPHASPAQVHAFERKQGLDRPLYEQFSAYLGLTRCLRVYERNDPTAPARGAHCGLLQGDLGRSYLFGEPVSEVIATRVPRTMLLGAMAIGFELIFGLLAGLVAALRRDSAVDASILVTTSLASSLPTFLLGPVALYVLAYLCGFFPIGGYGTTGLDHVKHAVLPSLVLSIGGAASYARLLRTEMVEAMRSEYVRAARARGLSETKVVHHALRNALAPIAALVGLSLPGLVGGAIISETIFGWPGLGRLSLQAVNALDAPMILAVVLMSALAVQGGNLIADLALAWLDPRVRLGRDGR
jgi:peptide/nickel transport system permease protein